ncbi:MAG: prepilin peptidase [Lachnospiraceae bacterium]|nr:prepilin peptidase [Lachnospiraceae bacterium]
MQPHDGILIIFLFYQSLSDMRDREVDLTVCGVTALTGVYYRILVFPEMDRIFCFLPGILVLALALITRGKVGLGDAWIILIMGLLVPGITTMLVLIVACLAQCLWHVVLFCGQRITSRRYTSWRKNVISRQRIFSRETVNGRQFHDGRGVGMSMSHQPCEVQVAANNKQTQVPYEYPLVPFLLLGYCLCLLLKYI